MKRWMGWTRGGLTAAICLSAGAASWNNSGGGNWNIASNWTPGDVPSVAGETAVIGLTGSFTVHHNLIGGQVDWLELTNADATLGINGGRGLTILTAAGVFNDGLIHINNNAVATNTALSFAAPGALLDGAGEILLDLPPGSTNVGHARLFVTGGNSLAISADQFVHGAGALDGVFTVNGLVAADQPGEELRISGDVTLAPAALLRGDGGTLGLGAVTIRGGTLAGINGGDVIVTPAFAVASLDDVALQGSIGVGANNTLSILSGGVTHHGTLTVNSFGASSNTTLRFVESATIDGTGEIVLSRPLADTNFARAEVLTNAGAVGTLGAGQVVRGTGQMSGTFVNLGEIRADVSGEELRLFGAVDQTGGGEIVADAGIASLGTVAINGGTLRGINGGMVEQVVAFTTSTLTDVTLNGAIGISGNNNTMQLNGSITNAGDITVNSRGLTANATLRMDGTTTLNGAGQISLSKPSGELFSRAALDIPDGADVTLGAGQTVRGTGIMDCPIGAVPPAIVNGLIVGDVAGEELRIRGNVDLSGGGVIRGTGAGAVAGLTSSHITGGELQGIGGGVVKVTESFAVAELEGVTLRGATGVSGSNNEMRAIGAGITIEGTLTVNADGIPSNATLRAFDGAPLNGGGEIVLNRPIGEIGARAQLLASGAGVPTIGANLTVRGTGRVTGNFVNEGSILADAAEPLEFSGVQDFSNQGLLRATGAGGLYIAGVINNDGGDIVISAGSNLELSFGSLVQSAGNILVNGTASNDGGDNPIILNGGLLTGAGQALRVENNARVEPGVGVGTLTCISNYVQNAGGTTAIQIGGFSAGTQHDVLDVAGAATLNGTLEITLENGLVPSVGDRFTVFQAASFPALFTNYLTPGFPTGLSVRTDAGAGTSADVVVVRPGDMNCDGNITVSDIAPFVLALTQPAEFAIQFPDCEILNGDVSSDSLVTVSDIAPFVALLTGG